MKSSCPARWIFVPLCLSLLTHSAHARSFEEAVDDLSARLGRQLGEQQVDSFGALEFTNLDGPQTSRERIVVDQVARRIGTTTGAAIFIGLHQSEVARAKFALPAGANIACETAARIAKLASAETMMVGTARRIDSRTIELVGQIFSAQRGVNLADARVTFTESRVAQAPPPREPVAPPPVVEPPAAPAPPAVQTNVMTTEAGQFLIELHGCERSSAGVECSFVLKNQGDNAKFMFHVNKTRLFDDQGREFKPGISAIADTRLDLRSHHQIQKQVIGGIPTRASIRFPRVASDSRTIASLQLQVAAPRWTTAEFRSVPIASPPY